MVRDPSEIYHTGTLAQVHPAGHAMSGSMGQSGGGGRSRGHGNGHGHDGSGGDVTPMQVFLTLHRRITFKGVVAQGPPMIADVSHWESASGGAKVPLLLAGEEGTLLRALSAEVVAVIRDLVRMNPLFREQTQFFTTRVDM